MTMLKPRSGMRLTVDEFMELPETDDRRKMELDEECCISCPDQGEDTVSYSFGSVGTSTTGLTNSMIRQQS